MGDFIIFGAGFLPFLPLLFYRKYYSIPSLLKKIK
jgi:hypothetical protein